MTDVTNASRTGLMDLQSLSWHAPTLRYFDVPPGALPAIRSNAEVYARVACGPLAGVPIAGAPACRHRRCNAPCLCCDAYQLCSAFRVGDISVQAIRA